MPGRARIRAAACPWREVTGVVRCVGVWCLRPIYVLSILPGCRPLDYSLFPISGGFPTRVRRSVTFVRHCAHSLVPGLCRESVIQASGWWREAWKCNDLLYCPVLIGLCPWSGWAGCLPRKSAELSLRGTVSGFNGCRGPRSRVTRGLSRLLALAFVSFVPFLGSCLSPWRVCSVRCPWRRFFSSCRENVSAAYGRTGACWAFPFSRCLVGSLSPCT